MSSRYILTGFIAFLLAINSLITVNGQSTDSLLYLLKHDFIREDTNRFKILCKLASNSVDLDTIVRFSDEAIALAEKLDISPTKPISYKGFGYLNSGRLASALECFMKAAGYHKASNNNRGLANTYLYMAETYNLLGNHNNEKDYLKNAIEIYRKEQDSINLALAMHNLGYANYRMGQYDSALVLFSETSEIFQRLGSTKQYAYCIGNSGLSYSRLSDFEKAEDYLLRAIDILNKQGDERAVTEYMIEYAAILQHKGEIKKAIACATRSFGSAITNNFKEYERDAAYRLVNLYQISGKYDSASYYQSVYISAKDSIESVKNIQKMADLRTDFEVAKKQAEVEVLEKNKLIQHIVIISLVIILILAIGMILLYYYSLKRSKRLSAALDERRILLEKQSRELKDQREELRQQKEEIISSINYAKYIQSSLLPDEETLKSLLGEHFVLYKPKDIVSGDFYWISNIENKTVIVAADCTGHGVPGAFMSMLGTALLNEIVNKEYITHPGVILRHLRKEVIHSLQQKGERGEQKDGMDIALCTIDLENMKLQFAGANNPLFIIRKSGLEEPGKLRCDLGSDDLLYEIKGDLMPIGISDKMDNYTFHEIDIFKGDTFYLFSDGFPDQFGGPDNRKFGYRRFREQLLKNNSKTLAENRILLEKYLIEWMGANSQIDDILVIGFRIG
jgi:serine phosphatase RsbU (regulator of sigma subunit)/Tfp pilus assembly protein PilF